ncbi:hypothetical protein CHO01_31710 [Cellulomonas hominis]|uniref:Uncharacterized protein n=1 Tax=Cellulomonas hominis TaxID=156981 RepID=A0A511FFM9_9CELL|nr:hypothetical protein [Cellulomonas hominis]MBB5474829.1 hypothetical protein [Cellulomonas hominis]NKY05643.1 hypothetical protein [Cellulomonas hominis]GEL48055.1 hypothetical protein CHO01_31710 [Cellulomonas hominis]
MLKVEVHPADTQQATRFLGSAVEAVHLHGDPQTIGTHFATFTLRRVVAAAEASPEANRRAHVEFNAALLPLLEKRWVTAEG